MLLSVYVCVSRVCSEFDEVGSFSQLIISVKEESQDQHQILDSHMGHIFPDPNKLSSVNFVYVEGLDEPGTVPRLRPENQGKEEKKKREDRRKTTTLR